MSVGCSSLFDSGVKDHDAVVNVPAIGDTPQGSCDFTRSRSSYSGFALPGPPYVLQETLPLDVPVPTAGSSDTKELPLALPPRFSNVPMTKHNDHLLPIMIPAADWPQPWMVPFLGPQAPQYLRDMGNQPADWMRTVMPNTGDGGRYAPMNVLKCPGGGWQRDEMDGCWRFFAEDGQALSPAAYGGGGSSSGKVLSAESKDRFWDR